jgi:hypothetical protein
MMQILDAEGHHLGDLRVFHEGKTPHCENRVPGNHTRKYVSKRGGVGREADQYGVQPWHTNSTQCKGTTSLMCFVCRIEIIPQTDGRVAVVVKVSANTTNSGRNVLRVSTWALKGLLPSLQDR